MKDFAGRCIHFNGIQHDTCKAGINYRELAGGEEFGMAKRLPCISENGIEPGVCASCHYPTPAEVAVMEAEFQGHMDAMRERNSILGAAHTDAPQSLVYLCLLCPSGARMVANDYESFVAHVAESHALEAVEIGQSKGKMAAHLDARDWYQTDEEYTLADGRSLCIRSSRQRRRGSNKAAWQDDTPKGRKRSRR